MKYCVVTPHHNEDQMNAFMDAWGIKPAVPDWLIVQKDINKEGCAVTKNKGIVEALDRKAEVVIVLDDDCYPSEGDCYTYHQPADTWLQNFVNYHLSALEPQPVELYEAITDPPSRGTPYFDRTMTMPVAASMGFWVDNPDWDAPGQLIYPSKTWRPSGFSEMAYSRKAMFWRFFAFSGMNCAFRSEFWPFFRFDETADRFDDIFMGYKLQREAYNRGCCINLNGPTVRHVRQSNVWKNLKIEAENLERNETEWQKYAKP